MRDALGTGVATALVFAAASIFALWLVGPRVEVRATVLIHQDSASRPAAASLVALAETEAFAVGVAGRLGAAATPVSRRLSDRIAAIVEGTPAGEAEDEMRRRPAGEVSVERGASDGEVVVIARAGTAAEAQEIATVVSAEIVARSAEEAGSSARATQLDGLRDAVADVERRLEMLPAPSRDPAAMRLRQDELRASGAELLEEVRGVEARIAASRAMAEAPSAVGSDAVGPLAPALADRLARYRSLEDAVADLYATLPADSPRLRIARARLAELETELRDLAARELRDAEGDRDRIVRRLSAIEQEADEIAAEMAAEVERESLMRDLRTAEVRLEDAQANPAPSAIARAGEPQEVRPPFLAVSMAAALIGFLTGSTATALRGWAAAREAPTPPGAVRAVDRPADRAPRRGQKPSARRADIVEAADLVSALAVEPVSQVLVASRAGAGSVCLALARRLAASGGSVLLVDVSGREGQARCARASSRSGPARDPESSVDIVALPVEAASDVASTSLTRAGGAYDHVIVDCGDLPASTIASLADADCAVVVAGIAYSADRAAEFDEAELATLTLAD